MRSPSWQPVARVAVVCFSLLAVSTISFAADKPLRDVIDERVAAKWKQEGIEAPKLSSDGVFLRRVYLDLCGTIPSYEEAKTFLEDKDPNKREKLIDKLLADPRYAGHQRDVWDQIYFGRNPPGYNAKDRDGFQKWLEECFKKNTPYDQVANELLNPQGSTVENGAPMYLIQYERKPEDATESITQIFLGVQLQCARCHDHPFEEWKQLDFYGMASFLARLELVELKKVGKDKNFTLGEKNTGDIEFTGPAKDQTPGKKGIPVKPKFLLGDQLAEPELPKNIKDPRTFPKNKVPPKPHFSRVEQLADWVTAVDNPYFARALANRVWGQFMGRGIVHPVDNMSPENEPSHPKLLDELSKQMISHKFDLKWYIRELCNSKTYQVTHEGEAYLERPMWFERAKTRPLSAEELGLSWHVATGAIKKLEEKHSKVFGRIGDTYMLRTFGKPANGVGDFQGGLSEHLFMNNGQMSYAIGNEDELIVELKNEKTPLEERVERLFISTLSRKPSEAEMNKLKEYLTADGGKVTHERANEAVWAMISCSEFRFNH